jgi:hypothetical protein
MPSRPLGKGNESKTNTRVTGMSETQKANRVGAAINKPDARKTRAEAGAKAGPRKKSTAGPVKATRKKDTAHTAK